jgi:hypothetical protein
MKVTDRRTVRIRAAWLFFIFQLPGDRASQRGSVWRKLQRYGALAWKNAAYILPNSRANQEKLQWLAAEVRKHRGEASVVEVARIEGTPDKQLVAMFNQARERDYDALIEEIRFALRPSGHAPGAGGALARLDRRLSEIIAIDAFGCARRREAEDLLRHLEFEVRRPAGPAGAAEARKVAGYRGRVWMTRPRPEVDRVASAWLIKRFIDPKARFVFSSRSQTHPRAVRFDMFEGDFTHVGDDCTFETLLKRFGLRDKRLRQISQFVHDADLGDNKFGRAEGRALDMVFKGWAKMGFPDREILRRGFELYGALHQILAV